LESGKWREFHPTIPGPVLPIFPFAPVGNTEIPFFSSISEPVDHRQLLTGNYSFRTPTAGDGGESVWDIPMNDISHERAHCILHTLMYPYTNALAINTVYGESVAYRVGSTRTHTHTHTHTHCLSILLALSGCKPTPREVDCTVLGGRAEHQSGLFLHAERGRRSLGCKGPRVWYEREKRVRRESERERGRERGGGRERERLFVCESVCLPACMQISYVRNMYVVHICVTSCMSFT